MHLVIPNTNNGTDVPNGNANGLAGNANIVFTRTDAGLLTNITITYAFCSSSNALLAENVANIRIRSFINQVSYLDMSVPVCDNIQGFCNEAIPQAGCLSGALVLNSSWPLLTVAKAPQLWIVGASTVTYGRYKANAEHTFADGPAAPTLAAVLAAL
jgi:hypothetical protein